MSQAVDTTGAQHRLECEARHGLRVGYTTPHKVAELMERIEKRRGIAMAIELRAEMRRQWKRPHDWQGKPA